MTDTTELRRRLLEALFLREQWTVRPLVQTDHALTPLESAENAVRTLTFELLVALDAEDAAREKRGHVVDIVREANTATRYQARPNYGASSDSDFNAD